MVHRNEPWPAGTPCWVDLMAADLPRSQEFYSAVLGWDYTVSDPQYGGYCNAMISGRLVAGMSPTMPGMESAPHVWTVYLATDDIAATAAAAQAAGASVLAPPMQVGSFGSMAVWLDPTGVGFGAWQSNEHTGYTLANEPGSVAWCDLMTPDYAASQAFYTQVFGYQYSEIGMGDQPYALFTVPSGQMPAGGMGPGSGGWTVCFEVADVEQAAATVVSAGGSILREPWDFEYGRLVAAAGPDGEAFSMLTSRPETADPA